VSSQPASDPVPERKPPLVTFHRFIPRAQLPQRADRSAIGTMPTRAFRYCEAIVTASAFGYYIFPPTTFSLMWDGSGVIWTWEGESHWHPLHVAQFPGFREVFDSQAPEEVREFSPPFLGAMQEPGIVQIWSGLVARTAPGWSLLIRPLANLPRSQSYELYEGIVETDHWFGPLFTNLRLTKTNVPIDFRADFPLFQVQPIPRDLYADQNLNNFELVGGLENLRPEDWDDYYDTVVRPNVQTDRPRGQYAAAARKRRAGEERDLPR
jgi:Family of unknown function (DUF6065)